MRRIIIEEAGGLDGVPKATVRDRDAGFNAEQLSEFTLRQFTN